MTKYHRPNAPPCDEPILYRGAGLDGIYLCNGFKREEVDGEWFTYIEDIEGLHEAIAFHLVEHSGVLGPKEIRFIRNTMDKTQAEIAEGMGVDVQTVARWEKGESKMPGPADRMLRVFFLLSTMSPEELRDFLEELPRKLAEREESVTFVHDKDRAEWSEGERRELIPA